MKMLKKCLSVLVLMLLSAQFVAADVFVPNNTSGQIYANVYFTVENDYDYYDTYWNYYASQSAPPSDYSWNGVAINPGGQNFADQTSSQTIVMYDQNGNWTGFCIQTTRVIYTGYTI